MLRNYTGVREEHEMWWGEMVRNTNKICGFGMELAGRGLHSSTSQLNLSRF